MTAEPDAFCDQIRGYMSEAENRIQSSGGETTANEHAEAADRVFRATFSDNGWGDAGMDLAALANEAWVRCVHAFEVARRAGCRSGKIAIAVDQSTLESSAIDPSCDQDAVFLAQFLFKSVRLAGLAEEVVRMWRESR